MSNSNPWLRASAAAFSMFLATSCYYDGYAGGGYSSAGYAYDSGYGYSGGGTTFVYTSSDRWFYDPEVYCYYDRYRRCYYDPYLYGYYPVGYCPRPVYGLPHPGGWRPGSRYCPPPSGFRDRRLSSYDNRVALLRQRDYSWSRSVRERNIGNESAWRNQRVRSADSFRERRDDNGGRRPDVRGPGSPFNGGVGNNNSWQDRNPGRSGPFPSSGQNPNWGQNPGRSPWQGQSPRGDGGVRFPRQSQQPGGDGRNWQRPGYNQPVDNRAAFEAQQRQRMEDARKADVRQIKGQRIVSGPRPEFNAGPQFNPRGQGRPSIQPQPQPQPRSQPAPSSNPSHKGRGDDDGRRGR